jgi:hypothetical protein
MVDYGRSAGLLPYLLDDAFLKDCWAGFLWFLDFAVPSGILS